MSPRFAIGCHRSPPGRELSGTRGIARGGSRVGLSLQILRRGSLSILSLALIFAPQAASAALSPWVDAVLEKAGRGVAYAQSQPKNPDCTADPESKTESVRQVLDTVRRYVDTRFQLTVRGRSLAENTVCLQSDLNLLEARMEVIRQMMESDIIQSCQLSSAKVLEEVYAFLGDATETLTVGGTDRTYADPNHLLETRFAFEGPLGESSATVAPSQQSCPFSSNYLPRSIAYAYPDATLRSYGCDSTVLSRLPEQAEAGPLRQFMDATDTFAANTAYALFGFLSDLNATIAQVPHHTAEPLTYIPLPQPVPHGEATGCLKLPKDPHLPGIEDYLQDEPDYFATPGPVSPEQTMPIGLLRTATSQPFSLWSAVSLIEQYVRFAGERGGRLPITSFPDYFGLLLMNLDGSVQSEPSSFQALVGNLDRYSSMLVSWNRDSVERMQMAIAPLTEAVSALENVTRAFGGPQPPGILPSYVRDAAYFLRRSCVYGPCNTKLDNVLKRITNPSCIPYASGLYTQDPDYVKKCFCKPPYDTSAYCVAQ